MVGRGRTEARPHGRIVTRGGRRARRTGRPVIYRKRQCGKNCYTGRMSEVPELTPSVSVIVPLAAATEPWRRLLPQLPENWQVLLAADCAAPADWTETSSRRWICCPEKGRGAQMNAAAALAAGDFLWFVHADSQPLPAAATALEKSIARRPQAVHYFDLKFYDGGWRMRLNEWGAKFRCAVFANPFGDQALCVPREWFARTGGFPAVSPGEDHLFVLRAAKSGVPICRVGMPMPTSARAYLQHGWWRLVCDYQKIWWRQWRQS